MRPAAEEGRDVEQHHLQLRTVPAGRLRLRLPGAAHRPEVRLRLRQPVRLRQGLRVRRRLEEGLAEGAVYTRAMDSQEPLETPAPLAVLLDNHRAFLRYLQRRVGDRELAEDILQDAFAKVVNRPDQAPADEGVVPWFYRTLRNAAIDQLRRRGAAARAAEAFARELQAHAEPEPELEGEICACVTRLAATLKPEYAAALQAIDVEATPVKVFAERHGLSAGNAGVRVFRARQALKKRLAESCGTCAEHGCRDCRCQSGPSAPP